MTTAAEAPTDIAHRSEAQEAWDWFVLDRTTGKSTVSMPPNLPISIFWTATGVRLLARPQGSWNVALQVTAKAALAWWAVDECVRGTSPLRRTLGAVTLTGLGVQLARARRASAAG